MGVPSDITSANPLGHPRVQWSRWKTRWPLLVWLVAAVAGLFMFLYGAHTGGMAGYVEIVEHPVASLELGRLSTVDVVVGQAVKAGDVVARLDATQIDAEMAAESALREEALVTLPASEQTALQLDRQFAAALASAQTALEEQRLRASQDQAELGVLDRELTRMNELLEKRMIDASAVGVLRARHAALTQAVALYPKSLREMDQRVEETRQQQQAAREALKTAGRTAGGGSTNFVAEVQAHRVAALQARRRECVLTAPAPGIVAQAMFRPGDVVMAGVPILTVVENQARRVIGFVPEISAREAWVGQVVQVERMYGLGRSFPARVSSLEPAVRGLPGQVNPVPGRTMRGRRVICDLDGENDLLPGETVQLRTVWPFWQPLIERVRNLMSSRGAG
jgi:HlyD family secretion protein